MMQKIQKFGAAFPEGAALLQKFRPRRPVDAVVHASAAQQGIVDRIDDGIHLHFGNVLPHKFQWHKGPPSRSVPFLRKATASRAFSSLEKTPSILVSPQPFFSSYAYHNR